MKAFIVSTPHSWILFNNKIEGNGNLASNSLHASNNTLHAVHNDWHQLWLIKLSCLQFFLKSIYVFWYTVFTYERKLNILPNLLNFTVWKVSKYGVIFGPKTGKSEPEITPYLYTFGSVFSILTFSKLWGRSTMQLLRCNY